MKAIDEILASEEGKWRGRSFKEIESIQSDVQCYAVTHGCATYHVEVQTERGKRANELIVRVECSKSILGANFGKAKYFAISEKLGVREIEGDEAF